MPDIRRLYQEKHSVLNTDSYDRERFAQLTELSPKLGEIVNSQMKQNRDFPALMGDMWASLYKMKPSLKEVEEEEQPINPINRDLMTKVMDDEHFQGLRKTTTLDDFSSAIGSMRLNEKVHEWLEEEKDKNEESKRLMEELRQKQQQLESQQKKQEKADQRLNDAQQNGDEKELKNANSQQKREQKKTDKLKQDLSDVQSQIQQLLAQAMQGSGGNTLSKKIGQASQETQQTKEDIQNLLSGGAGNGESELRKIPLRDQLNLAAIISDNPKVKKVAEWAGKFKSIARKKQKSKHTESLDRSGMTLGDDVERLLPQELGMLSNKATKLDFLRRFAEGQTMMYSPKGKETLGKGPIVVCLDQSGSMFELDEQSKGFVLALAMIAKKQRRNFAVITFSIKSGRVFSFEKGKISPKELVDIAEFFQGGGTKYSPVLKEAKEFIQKEKRFKKADILFVTDGDPNDTGVLDNPAWQSEFMDFKKQTSTSVMSLLIGNNVNSLWVKKFSDKVVQASDFDSDESHDILAI